MPSILPIHFVFVEIDNCPVFGLCPLLDYVSIQALTLLLSVCLCHHGCFHKKYIFGAVFVCFIAQAALRLTVLFPKCSVPHS